MVWNVKNKKRRVYKTFKIAWNQCGADGSRIYDKDVLLEALKNSKHIGEITHIGKDGIWFGV